MRKNARNVSLLCLDTLPLISGGSDVAAEILAAVAESGERLESGDIVVVAQKVISKSERRVLSLAGLRPSERALALAQTTGKDPRLVQAVLDESSDIVRAAPNVLIAEHRSGHIMANAGIDRSNLDAGPADEDLVLLLPDDADLSASRLRDRLADASGADVGVIISDSFGRPWRVGTTGVALGIAGVPAVVDRRGDPDLFGRPLEVTEVGFADSVAAAAVLAMGEGSEGCPAVVCRGLDWQQSRQTARDLLRPRKGDLFR